MQIPIINGIYSDDSPDLRTSYPRNLVPVPKDSGISKGYLRPSDGITELSTGPGEDRGAINWENKCYRVMGSKLIQVNADGAITVIGDVGDNGKQVTMDYSFDYLAIASNTALYLYDGTTLAQNVDPDLGTVLDVKWIDGYFMTTDGEFLVVTDITDPFAVNPLKYGSAEANPDPINGLLKLRNEIYALNRYTIEVFSNVGAAGFPFQRINGARIDRGSIGTHSCTVFMQSIAFLGGALNEAPAVWIGQNGSSTKISTREIDQILQEYTELQLTSVIFETKFEKSHEHLYIHLPDRTLVYDGNASQVLGTHVWFTLTSGIESVGQYRARNFVYCYDIWMCGDPIEGKIGKLTSDVSTHYGEEISWEFGTTIIYNGSNGAIFHELELVSLTGRVILGDNPTVWTRYSLDGVTWSIEKPIGAGMIGQRNKRLIWLQQGNMQTWRIQNFRGTSRAHMSVIRLEARIEPLNE